MFEMSICHIVEPWACHYELFYSVIFHLRQKCQTFRIYSSMPSNTKEDLIAFTSTLNCVLEIYPSLRLFSLTSDSIVWINTTHIHSNKSSYNYMLNFLDQISKSNLVSKVYAVVHNQFDLQFLNHFFQPNTSSTSSISPIVLSSDMVGYFLENTSSTIINSPLVFHPFLPNYYLQPSEHDQASSGPVRCLITGMAREGKGFKLLHHFADLIRNNVVSFSYVGWVPSSSSHSSGLSLALSNGLIDRATVDPTRVLESVVADVVKRCDVLIDLKIPPLPFHFTNTSGLLAISRTFNKPILCHTYQYPTQSAIRFNSITDLHYLLSNYQNFRYGISVTKKTIEYNSRQSHQSNQLLFESN